MEHKKGEQVVSVRNYIKSSQPTIIITNESSIVDYFTLKQKFSPIFVSFDMMKDKDEMGLRVISGFELARRAMGIRFPVVRDDLYKSFKELRDA